MYLDIYQNGMPENLFDIWFRHRIRTVLRYNRLFDGGYREYAGIINEDPELVRLVSEGLYQPSQKILDDMELTFELTSYGFYYPKRLENE